MNSFLHTACICSVLKVERKNNETHDSFCLGSNYEKCETSLPFITSVPEGLELVMIVSFFFNPAVLINFTFLLNIRENSHFSSLLAFLYFMCLVFNCSQLLFKYTTVHIYSIFYPLFASVLAQP